MVVSKVVGRSAWKPSVGFCGPARNVTSMHTATISLNCAPVGAVVLANPPVPGRSHLSLSWCCRRENVVVGEDRRGIHHVVVVDAPACWIGRGGWNGTVPAVGSYRGLEGRVQVRVRSANELRLECRRLRRAARDAVKDARRRVSSHSSQAGSRSRRGGTAAGPLLQSGPAGHPPLCHGRLCSAETSW